MLSFPLFCPLWAYFGDAVVVFISGINLTGTIRLIV